MRAPLSLLLCPLLTKACCGPRTPWQVHIPTVLIQRDIGERLRAQLVTDGGTSQEVVAEMDWREAVTHPDDRVEWQLVGQTAHRTLHPSQLAYILTCLLSHCAPATSVQWFSVNEGTRG